MRAHDLTGKKFERLLVAERVPQPENRKTIGVYWRCICDCGKEKICSSESLKKGDVQSCGCLHRENVHEVRFNDISGQKFSKLLAVEFIRMENNQAVWRCLCDCGNYANVISKRLVKKSIRSCGCTRYGVSNLLGMKFDRFTVIERAENRSHPNSKSSVYWKCVCDCGNIVEVSAGALKKGEAKSCGCIGEEKVKKQRERDRSIDSIDNLYKSYKKRANNLKLAFDLTKEVFASRITSPCYYCGVSSSNELKMFSGMPFLYNGLDRVDNSKGYTKDNAVPCCKYCNMGKRGLSKTVFLEWINRTYLFQLNKDKEGEL